MQHEVGEGVAIYISDFVRFLCSLIIFALLARESLGKVEIEFSVLTLLTLNLI